MSEFKTVIELSRFGLYDGSVTAISTLVAVGTNLK
jgi:hypothetical protein